MRAGSRSLGLSALFLGAALVVCVALPIASLFVQACEVDLGRIYATRSFTRALGNSLTLTAYATVVSIALAWIAAYFVMRVAVPARRLFGMLLCIPMLIPSLSQGMGLVVLFGANGVLTRLFGLDGSIYGIPGIVAGSVMYAFPVAFLMIGEIYRFEDASPVEAARVLGIPPARRFAVLTLPFFARPMICVVFAVFTLIVTDYGVPLTVGGKVMTLPVLMYQETVGLLNFPKGAAIGIVLLVPAVIAFAADRFAGASRATGVLARRFTLSRDRRLVAAGTAVLAVLGAAVLAPVAAFAVLSFTAKYPLDIAFSLRHVQDALTMRAGDYLLNSVLIALLVAAVGTYFATFAAYFSARVRTRMALLSHFLSMMTLAVPGIVLGLSYVLFFEGSVLYATIALLVMVNTVHFLGSPYLMAYNAFLKINPHLEGVAATLRISPARLLFDVMLPMTRATRIEMAFYFFVNSMVTISAVAFLAGVDTKPLALMINQFEAQMMLECSALVSVVILVVNVAAKGLTLYLKRRLAF